MPVDYKNYPPNWKAISQYIRFTRAKGYCEFCGAEHFKPHPVTGSMVILTVAHLGIDKPDGTPGSKTDLFDTRPENLAALCQRCHLNLDRPDIILTQRQNRAKKEAAARVAGGQLELLKHG